MEGTKILNTTADEIIKDTKGKGDSILTKGATAAGEIGTAVTNVAL